MVADAHHFHVMLVQALDHPLQIIEGAHLPCHVVETHSASIRPGGVRAQPHQGDFVSQFSVRRKEADVGHTVHDGKAQYLGVELLRSLHVRHEDVHMTQLYRFSCHAYLLHPTLLPCESDSDATSRRIRCQRPA